MKKYILAAPLLTLWTWGALSSVPAQEEEASEEEIIKEKKPLPGPYKGKFIRPGQRPEAPEGLPEDPHGDLVRKEIKRVQRQLRRVSPSTSETIQSNRLVSVVGFSRQN